MRVIKIRMLCPRCGKPVPPGAAFCPACGTPVAAAPAPRPAAPVGAGAVAADFEAQGRRNRLMMVGVGLAALLAAFFGARAFGLLRLGASSPKPGLQVRAEGPAPALQMPAKVGPPGLQIPGSVPPPTLQEGGQRKEMPADVRDWLNHLQECERRKVALATDQTAEAMVASQRFSGMGAAMNFLNDAGEVDPGPDNKDAGDVGRDKILSFRPPWGQLVEFFNSKRPPAECLDLASDYSRALGEMGGSMGDIADLLNGASKDPSSALKKAYAMQGKSPEQIDRFFGSASDKYIGLCDKYETRPWFEIKKDVAVGGGLSLFGGAGAGGLGR